MIDLMQGLAEGIDEALRSLHGERTGFVLLTFKFNSLERGAYISNANRQDIIATLESVVKEFKAQPDLANLQPENED